MLMCGFLQEGWSRQPHPTEVLDHGAGELTLKTCPSTSTLTGADDWLRPKDIALGFLDESSPQNRANTVRVWSFEKSPKVIKNTTHFKSNTIGFYAIVGNSVRSFLEDSKKE